MANRPKLTVPVSHPENIQKVRFTVDFGGFDGPKEVDGRWGPSYMYTIYVDGVEHVLFASGGLQKELAPLQLVSGDDVEVYRIGDDKNTQWYVKKIGASTSVTPAQPPSQNDTAAVTHPIATPPTVHRWTPPDMEVIMRLAADRLDKLEGVLALVNVHDTFKDMTDEQKLSVAVGSLIYAERTYRPGLVVKEKTRVELFLEAVVAAYDGSGDLVGPILQATLIYTDGFEDKAEIIDALKAVGLSSAAINPEDANTWTMLFKIAHYIDQLKIANDEQWVEKTKKEFGISDQAF